MRDVPYPTDNSALAGVQDAMDRSDIDALRSEFTDAVLMKDYERFASLFAEDGVWQMPHVGLVLTGRWEIRAGVERMQSLWEIFIQTTHGGTVQLAGDTASGRGHVSEFGRLRDGRSGRNTAVYHDKFRRSAEGWKFTERTHEMLYVDFSPLEGTTPYVQDAYSHRP
ncbi:nuclear transport factor 2 family protein [Streptomyces sp. NPDC006475]|uniref:nuclear transport factor 2 family protein n=1 Tax=Streptomyces sp. NPDC006475 TaxID=3155719 RepID=UPI0033B33A21